ncbi:NAD(P)/FAD-dependent oxidoreductase [Candidatus Bipolaricaulota bacterium]|nr:NAD(P)/FAD-dependent oxidoreductase [Candidatus Bipolaricaulota bacterium]
MQSDVAIVGAGPIGLAAARAAAQVGARTLLLERRPEGAPPSCCTGLISPRTLSTLHVSDSSVLQQIHAICIHLPSGLEITLRSDDVKAFTICRRTLEAELLQNAREAGASVRFETEVTAAASGKLSLRSARTEEHITTSVIIGADGPRSQVADWFSLDPPSAFIAAAQVELEGAFAATDQVEVFVGERVAPGFFGWCAPAEDGVARVGVGVLPDHSPAMFLDCLLARHFPNHRIRSRSAGIIPLASSPRPAAEGVLLVGDAAGHVKPLSGGGLYLGGTCAQIAGEMAAQATQPGAALTELASAYSRRCQEAIGREQAFGCSIRHHLSRLKDEEVEAAATVLQDRQFMQFLADHADIDQFHRLPDHIASEPHLWTTLLRIIPFLGLSSG